MCVGDVCPFPFIAFVCCFLWGGCLFVVGFLCLCFVFWGCVCELFLLIFVRRGEGYEGNVSV